jgi:hypothetical protein
MAKRDEKPMSWPGIEHPAPNKSEWAKRARRGAIRSEAARTARLASRGHTRAERRTMLEREMARRNVAVNPVWIELQLDQMELSRVGRAARTLGVIVKAVRILGDSSTRRPIFVHAEPSVTRSSFRDESGVGGVRFAGGSASGEWAAIDLSGGAGPVLEHVFSESHHEIAGVVPVAVAIVRPQPREDEATQGQQENAPPLAVRVASDYVGVLDADASSRFAPMVDRAAASDAAIDLIAYATRAPDRRPPYLLAVELPIAQDRG